MNTIAAEKPSVKLVLPTSKGDLVAGKVLKLDNIHDHVEPLFIDLWDDASFRNYFEAVYDAEAIEGGIKADEVMAAIRVRERAVETGDHYLQAKNLTAIVKSLHVIMNRFGLNRTARRAMVGGQNVPGATEE